MKLESKFYYNYLQKKTKADCCNAEAPAGSQRNS